MRYLILGSLIAVMLVTGAWTLLPESYAAGNTYYVATNGSDSNSGTQSQPFRTINKGTGTMNGGDTLIVKAGIYAECLNTTDFKSGTAQARTVIKRNGTDTVTLKPNSGQCHHAILIVGERKYITLDGINVDGSNVPGNTIKLEAKAKKRGPFDRHGADHYLETASFIEIVNAKLSNAGNCGLQGRANNSVFRNLEIHGTRSVCYGYYFNGHDTVIENNNIHHNANGGMQIYSQAGDTTINQRMHIRNNWVHDNCTNVGTSCIGGILIANGADNYIYNNIVANNNSTGIRSYSATQSTRIYNNTVVNHGTGIHLHDQTGLIVRNNILHQNRTPIAGSNSSTTQSNNLTTDPKFISSSDFHLQLGSPAINAGISLPEVPCDFDGNKRPGGSAYDIGAFEYGSSPGSGCSPRPSGGGGQTPTPTPTPTSIPR
jgi:parallel beta-helix repeat protein